MGLKTPHEERLPYCMVRPPVEWDALVSGYSEADRKRILDELDGLMQRAAMTRGYINARQKGYSHDPAAREANSLLVKVRKLLGFSNQKAGCFPFAGKAVQS